MRSFAFEFKEDQLNKAEIEEFIEKEVEFCCKDPKGLKDTFMVGINKELLEADCRERKNGDGKSFPTIPLITIMDNTLYINIVHYYHIMEDFIKKFHEKYKEKIQRIYDDYNTDYTEKVREHGVEYIFNN